MKYGLTARGASLADFIQPSLGPLQPNLDDFMDTLEPLQGIIMFIDLISNSFLYSPYMSYIFLSWFKNS